MTTDNLVHVATVNGRRYDIRPGSPFNCGCEDSFSGAAQRPHYYTCYLHGYLSQEVVPAEGSREWTAYMDGYAWNEAHGTRQDRSGQ